MANGVLDHDLRDIRHVGSSTVAWLFVCMVLVLCCCHVFLKQSCEHRVCCAATPLHTSKLQSIPVCVWVLCVCTEQMSLISVLFNDCFGRMLAVGTVHSGQCGRFHRCSGDDCSCVQGGCERWRASHNVDPRAYFLHQLHRLRFRSADLASPWPHGDHVQREADFRARVVAMIHHLPHASGAPAHRTCKVPRRTCMSNTLDVLIVRYICVCVQQTTVMCVHCAHRMSPCSFDLPCNIVTPFR